MSLAAAFEPPRDWACNDSLFELPFLADDLPFVLLFVEVDSSETFELVLDEPTSSALDFGPLAPLVPPAPPTPLEPALPVEVVEAEEVALPRLLDDPPPEFMPDVAAVLEPDCSSFVPEVADVPPLLPEADFAGFDPFEVAPLFVPSSFSFLIIRSVTLAL